MPTRKIADLPKYCRHPNHNPPSHQVFEDGIWEHICPGCGDVTTFTVSRPRFGDTRGTFADHRGRFHSGTSVDDWYANLQDWRWNQPRPLGGVQHYGQESRIPVDDDDDCGQAQHGREYLERRRR